MKNKTRNIIAACLACVLCVTGAFIWTGCDTASATEELVITPSSVALSAGESQLFTVSGGYHYSWELTESISSTSSTSSTKGYLSSLAGSEVRYFAPEGEGLSGTVTLLVKSTIPGTAGTSSNSPDYEVRGYAKITFK